MHRKSSRFRMSNYFASPPREAVYKEPETRAERFLQFLSLGQVVKEHIKKDRTNEEKLWAMQGHFLHLTTDRLVSLLREEHQQQGPEHLQSFDELCRFLYHASVEKYRQANGKQLYDSLFNPAVKRDQLKDAWRYQNAADNQREAYVQERELDFLNQVTQCLEGAQFNCLTRQEFYAIDDIATQESQFTVPLQIDWDRLDGDFILEFIRHLFNHAPQQSLTVPEYASRCMIFWRGISCRRTRGYFRMRKFNRLLQEITKRTGLDQFSKFVLRQSEFAQNKPKASANDKVFADREILANEEQQELPSTSTHPPISQKVLRVGYGPGDFFKEEELEELVFDEMILIYRKKPSAATQRNPHAIYVQRFNRVPLKDYAHIFPAKRTGTNFADIFYFMMIFSMILTVLFKLQHAWASATYADEVAVGVFFVFLPLLIKRFVRTVAGMRTHTQHRNISQGFVESSLECSSTVLSYLRDEAIEQEFINTLLAYHILHRASPSVSSSTTTPSYASTPAYASFGGSVDSQDGLSARGIQIEVETFAQEHCNVEANYDVHSACRTLTRYNMVTHHGSCYQALPVSQCVDALQSIVLHPEDDLFE